MPERIKSTGKESKPPRNTNYALNALEELINTNIARLVNLNTPLAIREAPEESIADYGIQVVSLARQVNLDPEVLARNLAQRFPRTTLIKDVTVQVNKPKEVPEKKDGNNSKKKKQEKKPEISIYLNFELNHEAFGSAVVNQVLSMGKEYGKENIGKGDRVVIDMSSPNIAKRMHVAHLRSTIIGESLSRIYKALGFEVIKDNHIGDWGTQFGKQICALRNWSSEEELLNSEDPINLMQELYVRYEAEIGVEKLGSFILKINSKDPETLAIFDSFNDATLISKGDVTDKQIENFIAEEKNKINHLKEEAKLRKQKNKQKNEENVNIELKEAEKNVAKLEKYIGGMQSTLEDEAREMFAKLEKGDPWARRIWKECVDLSLKEFQTIYDILGIEFDSVLGESSYTDLFHRVNREVKNIKTARMSNGALIVDMTDVNLGVEPVFKSDDSSLYITRDIAAIIRRQEDLKADRIIYVVGANQKEYFKKLFVITKWMGYAIAENSIHVYFGIVSLPEGPLSTRKGRVILLKDVISEGISRATAALDDLEEAKSELTQQKWDALSTSEKERLQFVHDLQEKREQERLQFKNAHKNEIAQTIALGTLVYNDLSQDPKRDIVFNWDKALSFEGNSAAAIDYVAVRAKSILQSSGVDLASISNENRVELNNEAYKEISEKKLIRALAGYPTALVEAYKENDPSKVAVYVYELSKRFNDMYTDRAVRILRSEDPDIRTARLRLVAATYQVIENALNVLGIEIPEAM